MDVRTFTDAAAFAERSTPFLLRDEPTNNLVLGLTHNLKRDLYRYGDEMPYMATVEAGGEVVAVALRTPPHALILTPTDADEALLALAHNVFERWPTLPQINGPSDTAARFLRIWGALSGQTGHLHMHQHIYKLEQIIPVTGVSGEAREASGADHDLIVRWIKEFQMDCFGKTLPDKDVQAAVDRWLSGDGNQALYFWEDDGQPVSMAGYGGTTPNGMRVSYVYTPPEQRRRGYASAVTAAVSQRILDGGRTFCFLYTDMANPTSNKIYQDIGYRSVGDVSLYDLQ